MEADEEILAASHLAEVAVGAWQFDEGSRPTLQRATWLPTPSRYAIWEEKVDADGTRREGT